MVEENFNQIVSYHENKNLINVLGARLMSEDDAISSFALKAAAYRSSSAWKFSSIIARRYTYHTQIHHLLIFSSG